MSSPWPTSGCVWPARMLAEIRRLLVPGGLLILEISRGRTAGYQPREFESFYWERADDVLALIEQQRFARMASSPFEDG
jgi:hypothetical protein